ncbi:glycosyltransferase [Conexibacter sp. S30A1]|uniref:glycosyltransferase family protein n=1 Tax=Conexibacter sp. S30A1 TaxID=2937800 RepID=UPI00200BCF6A|nr:glycosyltransferase [Conexibacter sp. S30A1]
MGNADFTRRPLRVALIARTPWDFPALLALATPGLEFGTFDVRRFGTPEHPNPFGLPLVASSDVVLVSSFWHNWLATNHPDAVRAAFAEFERRASTVVGLDSEDAFPLLLPPWELDRYALIIKAHGVYRDRDLYNYKSGAPFPGDQWHSKLTRREHEYSDTTLAKLRLGPPCFARDILAIRRSSRRHTVASDGKTPSASPSRHVRAALKATADLTIRQAIFRVPVRGRWLDVHCLGSVSHTQRLTALRALEGFSGVHGATGVPDKFRGLVPDAEFTPQHRPQVVKQAAPYMRSRTNRLRYYTEMCQHKVVVAPSGYGELTFRHGEALRAGAALVCPSLDHVDIRFPFEDGGNVIWCKTDVSDLHDRVAELLADDDRRARIAAAGRRDILKWERTWRQLLDDSIAAPLREAAG